MMSTGYELSVDIAYSVWDVVHVSAPILQRHGFHEEAVIFGINQSSMASPMAHRCSFMMQYVLNGHSAAILVC